MRQVTGNQASNATGSASTTRPGRDPCPAQRSAFSRNCDEPSPDGCFKSGMSPVITTRENGGPARKVRLERKPP